MSANTHHANSQTSFQANFVTGLLDPDAGIPDDVHAPAGASVMSRYNVYRNNVTVSLINALASVYPAVQRITGVDFFRAMARFYVRAKPPASPLLFEYGRQVPAFIESYEYAQQMPWLADVARLERAWLDAYHAADLSVIEYGVFAELAPDLLGSLRFTPHPATRIVRSAYPAVTIFAMNRREAPVSPICSTDSEDGLVTRPDHEVLVSKLPPGGAVFLSRLIDGASLDVAVSEAFTDTPSFDLQVNLAGMISAGVFIGVTYGES